MGPGPGIACAITLNSALTPEQQRLYQDPLIVQRLGTVILHRCRTERSQKPVVSLE